MRRGIQLLLACVMTMWLMGSAWAAPSELVPVGRCVGITLEIEGVTVVGFAENNTAAKTAGLRRGDRILRIDGKTVEKPEEIRALLRPGEKAVVCVLRSGRENTFTVAIPASGELGVLVRDSISGIGTVTFYDPETEQYGALGHGVSDAGETTDDLTPVAAGHIVSAEVAEVTPGKPGQPGALRGAYDDTVLGTVERNTPAGVFGYGKPELTRSAAPLGEATVGAATILANVSGRDVSEYAVEILEVDAAAETRNLLVQVTDPELLKMTGGIVQGMSGSPILQDGKLVGAVTHVLVSDAAKGYGILIEHMLEAAA